MLALVTTSAAFVSPLAAHAARRSPVVVMQGYGGGYGPPPIERERRRRRYLQGGGYGGGAYSGRVVPTRRGRRSRYDDGYGSPRYDPRDDYYGPPRSRRRRDFYDPRDDYYAGPGSAFGRGYGGRSFIDNFFDDRRQDDMLLSDAKWFERGRMNAAGAAGVPPAWFDVVFGCFLFALLNLIFKEIMFTALPTQAANAAAGRALAMLAFTTIQQASFLPTGEWVRFDTPDPRDVERPFFASPWNGITCAFLFAVPVALIAKATGVAWLPPPRPFNSADSIWLDAIVAPVAESLFFQGWLTTAIAVAGGSEASALVASAILFGLYHMQFSSILDPGGGSLLIAYQLLGGYLSFLYQRSGYSLPLVIITHATLRLIELGGGRVLPFGLW